MNIRVDKRLYSDEVISKCVYWYTSDFTVIRQIDGNDEIIDFLPRNSLSMNEDSFLDDFWRKLNDYKLREIIERQTREIRIILYAKAFEGSEDITEEELLQ